MLTAAHAQWEWFATVDFREAYFLGKRVPDIQFLRPDGCLSRRALRPAVVVPHADVADQPSLGCQVAQAQESQSIAALSPLCHAGGAGSIS